LKANFKQTSFVSGEWSPRALGRTDLDRYEAALKRCRNAYPLPQGGVRRRPGTRYVDDALTTDAYGSILVPFVAGRDEAFIVEMADLQCRVRSPDGAIVATLTSPYAQADLASLDWAQADRTMWLFNGAHPIYRLQLFDGGVWALAEARFTSAPFGEFGRQINVTASLSSAAVGAGRTVLALASVFLPTDVGRGIIANSGLAVITAYNSPLNVTVEVTRAFASIALPADEWLIDVSPQTTCTPSAKDPVGTAITLTLAADGWRSDDVGSMVRINGGLCEITGYTSATVVAAVIVDELSATTAAPALAWGLLPPAWGKYPAWGYPRTGTMYQQRLIAAGSAKFPRTVWGSRLGEPLDFAIGTTDDRAFSFTLDGDESGPIAYVSAMQDLAVMTESGELSIRSGVEKPLTPTNIRVRPDSTHGSAAVRPLSVSGETIFVQRSGRKVRSHGYRYDVDRYSSPDITALAEHLLKPGVVWMSYQQEPDPIIWAGMADGSLLSCTVDRDQQPIVMGWARHETQGQFEAGAVIPSGDMDVLWVIVRRSIGGVEKRYLEYFDVAACPFHPDVATEPDYGLMVDCAAVIDNNPGFVSVTAAHLASADVEIVGDGSKLPAATVSGGGNLSLPRAVKRCIVGLSYDTEITLLPPELPPGAGSINSRPSRTARLTMRFVDTIGARVSNAAGGAALVPFQRLGSELLDQAPLPKTGVYSQVILGWDVDDETSITQAEPMPLHILSVIREHTGNT
jgi:hypothetical protein